MNATNENVYTPALVGTITSLYLSLAHEAEVEGMRLSTDHNLLSMS